MAFALVLYELSTVTLISITGIQDWMCTGSNSAPSGSKITYCVLSSVACKLHSPKYVLKNTPPQGPKPLVLKINHENNYRVSLIAGK